MRWPDLDHLLEIFSAGWVYAGPLDTGSLFVSTPGTYEMWIRV